MTPGRRAPHDIAEELKELAQRPEHDRDRLTLEVQVYQEELIVQNEALSRALSALEETRDQFVELYDFSPHGYLTLDGHGIILRINLTGTSLLGKHRNAVEGMPLLGFIAASHRPHFLDFLRQCRSCEDGRSVSVEVALAKSKTQVRRHVQLLCRPRKNQTSGERAYLTSMLDITERKRLEAEKDRAAHERAALAVRLISIQDEERHRIARDLHDNIGQHVTALRLKLAAIPGGNPEQAAERVEAAERVLTELDKQLDFISRELRPTALDLGIPTALRQFVSDWSQTFGIRADFHTSGFTHTRLPPTSETHLYRVAQEALNNIYKHAGATSVSVILEERGGDVVLIIEDNGCGFHPGDVRGTADAGLGLVSMRERAEIIGGALDVESERGKGTTVFLRIPEPRQRAQR